MRLIGSAILAVACSAPLAGCGQKGPLYLPPAQPAPQSKASSGPLPDAGSDRASRNVPATNEKK